MRKFIESLLAGGMRMRIASTQSDDRTVLRKLIEEVFVKERGYMKQVEEDCWDTVSKYYLLKMHDQPVGCVRFVDPGAFPWIPNSLPRKGGRICFPMEEYFPLDAYVEDSSAFAEPGRFILIPTLRKRGGFVALAATAYLYGIRNRKQGVCMASPIVVEPFLKLGWRRMGEQIWLPRYESYGHPLTASPHDVSSDYQSLFLSLEQSGVIVI